MRLKCENNGMDSWDVIDEVLTLVIDITSVSLARSVSLEL